jgi:hypothetical protein
MTSNLKRIVELDNEDGRERERERQATDRERRLIERG